MNNDIKVSVVCNAYNHGKYIRETLESFVSQKTDFSFEVLVHDDASPDNTADIIREYEQKYPHIIKPICQTENQYSKGVGITRIYQIPRVRGKYVALCEGDDYWTDPLKLQKQYDFLEAHPEYALCACSTVWVDMETGKSTGRCRTEQDRDISLEEIILETKGRIFQYATIMVRASVFCGMPEWTRHFGVGDTPLAIYAATCGKVHMLSDTMAVYRNHAAGSWTANMEKSLAFKINSFRRMIDGLQRFNEATGHQYNQVVEKRITRLNYNIARANRDWRAMRRGELREVYQSKRFLARMSDMLYCKAPRLEAAVRRLLE